MVENKKVMALAALSAILIAYLVAGIVAIYWGRLTGDEGLYAYAAVNTLDGKVPYRDFLFTQMPLFPYFYAPFMALFGKTIVTARWLSLLLGFAGLVAASAAAWRRGGAWAALICAIFLGLNLNYVFDTAAVKTQALTVFWTAAGVLFLSQRHLSIGRMVVALVCINLAFVTRLSMLPVLVLCWLYVYLMDTSRIKILLPLFALNCLMLFSVFFFFRADGNMLFGVYHFHREFWGNLSWSWGHFVKFCEGFLSNQFSLIFFFVISGCLFLGKLRNALKTDVDLDMKFLSLLMLSYLTTSFIHMNRSVSWPIYQTSNIVFICVFTAVITAQYINGRSRKMQVTFVSLLLAMVGLNAPFQEYVVNFNGNGGLGKMNQAICVLRSQVQPGLEPILTFETELALEGKYSLLPHYEMGLFSYFPNMEASRTVQLNVLNFDGLHRDIAQKKAGLLCLTKRNLIFITQNRTELSEMITDTLNKNYILIQELEEYGQFFDTLYIAKARP